MPAAGKKKGKGKKKKGKKAKMVGNETPVQVVKRFLKSYEKQCLLSNSGIFRDLRKTLKAAMETESLPSKKSQTRILYSEIRSLVTYLLIQNYFISFVVEGSPIQSPDDLPVSIDPLIVAIRQERYAFIKDLHVWDMALLHETVANLALLIEKGLCPVRQLELMDCLIEPYSIKRLSLSFRTCETLTHIILDYNEFGNEGCRGLCAGLEGNRLMLSVSMCYCDLGVESGKMLGRTISLTAVRELFLDGNDLQCEGAVELIKMCADHAEVEAYQREQAEAAKLEEEISAMQKLQDGVGWTSGSEGEGRSLSGSAGLTRIKSGKKKKGKKKKKKKKVSAPPPVGPWIHKLHLADNGIDIYDQQGNFASLICMRLFARLITYSKCLEEIDLDDNLIGDLGGREILEALQNRKEASLPSMKLRTTHRMRPDTFSTILKLGAGLKKKKKKKGKKKKKR